MIVTKFALLVTLLGLLAFPATCVLDQPPASPTPEGQQLAYTVAILRDAYLAMPKVTGFVGDDPQTWKGETLGFYQICVLPEPGVRVQVQDRTHTWTESGNAGDHLGEDWSWCLVPLSGYTFTVTILP